MFGRSARYSIKSLESPGSVAVQTSTACTPSARSCLLDSRQRFPTELLMRLIGLVLAVSLAFALLAAGAQLAPKVARVGVLAGGQLGYVNPSSSSWSSIFETETALGLTIPPSVLGRADQVIQ